MMIRRVSVVPGLEQLMFEFVHGDDFILKIGYEVRHRDQGVRQRLLFLRREPDMPGVLVLVDELVQRRQTL